MCKNAYWQSLDTAASHRRVFSVFVRKASVQTEDVGQTRSVSQHTCPRSLPVPVTLLPELVDRPCAGYRFFRSFPYIEASSGAWGVVVLLQSLDCQAARSRHPKDCLDCPLMGNANALLCNGISCATRMSSCYVKNVTRRRETIRIKPVSPHSAVVDETLKPSGQTLHFGSAVSLRF